MQGPMPGGVIALVRVGEVQMEHRFEFQVIDILVDMNDNRLIDTQICAIGFTHFTDDQVVV